MNENQVLTPKQLFDEARAGYDASRKSLKDASKHLIKCESKALFEKYPEMESFSWTQYTPYFNDGDQCVFHSYHDYPHINGETMYGEKRKGWLGEAEKEVKELLKNFNDTDMKRMFGDHVEVTVTKDKIEVSDHEHD